MNVGRDFAQHGRTPCRARRQQCAHGQLRDGVERGAIDSAHTRCAPCDGAKGDVDQRRPAVRRRPRRTRRRRRFVLRHADTKRSAELCFWIRSIQRCGEGRENRFGAQRGTVVGRQPTERRSVSIDSVTAATSLSSTRPRWTCTTACGTPAASAATADAYSTESRTITSGLQLRIVSRNLGRAYSHSPPRRSHWRRPRSPRHPTARQASPDGSQRSVARMIERSVREPRVTQRITQLARPSDKHLVAVFEERSRVG